MDVVPLRHCPSVGVASASRVKELVTWLQEYDELEDVDEPRSGDDEVPPPTIF